MRKAVDEFMRGYFSTHRRGKKTKAAYSADLEQFSDFAGGERVISTLNGGVVRRWMEHLKDEEYSPVSIKRKMATLRVFCTYWVRKGVLPESPFWRMELEYEQVEQTPRIMEEKEVRALLAQARRNHLQAGVAGGSGLAKLGRPRRYASPFYRAIRDLALIEVLSATGMRVGEIFGLDCGDFDVRKSAFYVAGVGGRSRLAYVLGVSASDVLLEYLKARRAIKSESPALFLNSSGDRLSMQGIANVIDQLCRQVGMRRRVTPGMFRNTVERKMLSKRVDLRVVMEVLGKTTAPVKRGVAPLTSEHVVGELRKVQPSLGF